jgi:hypothetical protein
MRTVYTAGLKVYTSSRHHSPSTFWRNRLPANVTYVRVLIKAESISLAERELHKAGLSRYAETLNEATPADLPAGALAGLHVVAMVGVFLLYRTDSDENGKALKPARFHIDWLTGGELRRLGRVRVVDTTGPQWVARIVAEDGQDDEYPIPGHGEGPSPIRVGEPVIGYPTGRLGTEVRRADGRLTVGVESVRDTLTELLGEFDLSRRSTNPRQARVRHSATLLELAKTVAGLAGDALVVETALHCGNE